MKFVFSYLCLEETLVSWITYKPHIVRPSLHENPGRHMPSSTLCSTLLTFTPYKTPPSDFKHELRWPFRWNTRLVALVSWKNQTVSYLKKPHTSGPRQLTPRNKLSWVTPLSFEEREYAQGRVLEDTQLFESPGRPQGWFGLMKAICLQMCAARQSLTLYHPIAWEPDVWRHGSLMGPFWALVFSDRDPLPSFEQDFKTNSMHT